MKKLRAILVIGLLCFLLPVKNSSAQVEKSTNFEIDVYLTKTYEDGRKDTLFTLTSGIEEVQVTQFSNYVRKVTFQIDPQHPIMKYANPVAFLYLTMKEDVDGDGVKETITSNRAVLTSKGKLSYLYHYNAKDKATK
ncbi:hypothetical protein [uncultured Draconibacterium sp.]|uniref:hypothetical protein n=1 Tax=uncultured Draconibacterium sp. TaxID=1573823 RepID=UPI0029C6B11F|nr:hypothetical protein [uncultured Draconibacterium sp.]